MSRQEKYTQQGYRRKGGHRTAKVLLLLILILLILTASLVGWSYKSTKESLAVSFTDKAPEVEVGGDYASMDYVRSSVGEVTASEEYLDADTTGDREITYTVTEPMYGGLLNPSAEFTLPYTVVDTEPPLKIWSGNGTVLQRGTEFDINKVIGYGDNADPEPKLTVDGEVDMGTNGKYPLHVTVTDASGNSTSWDLTVEVADSVPVYTDNSERTKFSDFAFAYAGDGRTFGIDVSTWQGDIDFDAVKAAGCDFAIIRIGYSKDGEITLDDKFDQNYERAKAAGIRTGIYLFSYDNTEKDVRAAADQIAEKLGEEVPELPVVFDWEDFGRFQTYKMSFADLNKLYDAFADELAGKGYDCMLYGNKNSLENIWKDTDTRPVWLAHYTDKTDYDGPYRMWQASCTGRIDGIDGDVDMDIMYR